MPLVSVVIPNWNGERLLPVCLDSVGAQTLGNIEVIVSDDGSTDGSVELLSHHYPEVKLVRSPSNRGFAAAANAGIRASRGEFIFLLNNDVALDPRCLEELLSAIRQDEAIGACAAKMVYYDAPSVINSAGHACGADGVVFDIGRGQRDGPSFSQPRDVLGPCAGSALYRRRMLESIGLFDESFVLSFEDADLNWRALWAGWRCRYVPTAIARHREGASRGLASRRSVELGLRNTILVWAKCWPTSSLIRHSPHMWRGLREAMTSLAFRGYGDAVLAAAWGAICLLPAMLARRRQLLRRRTAPLATFEHWISGPPQRAFLRPFDSGLRLGIRRLLQQACAGVLSLLIILLVAGMASVTDAAEALHGGRTPGRQKTR